MMDVLYREYLNNEAQDNAIINAMSEQAEREAVEFAWCNEFNADDSVDHINQVVARQQNHNWQSNENWLADPANRDSEIYGDVFKDTYGFRPRW